MPPKFHALGWLVFSFLPYCNVLYPFVYPLLRTVSVDDPNYYLACYLMNTMSSFLPISDEEIEKTAVLREFIGGSLFE